MAALREQGVGRWLLVLSLAAGAFAALVAWTGGFDLSAGSMRLRSRDAARPAVIAGLAFVLFVIIDHRWARLRLAGAWPAIESRRAAHILVAGAVLWTSAVGVLWNTWAAGGADSYGYVSQVELFRRGTLVDQVPFDPAFSWRHAAGTLVPLGYVATEAAEVIAPTYPPGLPLLMVPASLLSASGVYLVVPLLAIVLIVAVARAGTRLGDPLAGAMAACLVAVSPTFLYQLVQPMSDIPAAAFWLVAALLVAPGSRASACAGICAAVAVLIRPNLAPLAAVLVVIGWRAREWTWRELAAFLAPLAIGILLLMAVQHVRYGSPTGSGYGSMAGLFSTASVPVNLRQYPRWITAAFTPLVWVCVFAPWAIRRSADAGLGWGLMALAGTVWLLYLPYIAFQPHEWHYTRFLLLALVIMVLLAVLVILRVVRAMLPEARMVLVVAVMAGWLFGLGHFAIVAHGVFDIQTAEQKYPVAGAAVRAQAGLNAWVFALQHSGSLRLYAASRTIRWDLVDPRDIDRVIEIVRGRYGHAPVAVLDPGEVDEFRQRFKGSQAVASMTLLQLAGETRIYGFR